MSYMPQYRCWRPPGTSLGKAKSIRWPKNQALTQEDATLANIGLVQTAELPGMLAIWQNKGFVVLGSSDLLIKNNEMGFSEGLRQAAVAAGASLAFFQITPAKLRAVQRKAGGRIDMDAVRAAPPVKMSPGGSSVVQLVLLVPVSLHARELAEAEFGSSHVPIGLEESSPFTAPPATLKTSS